MPGSVYWVVMGSIKKDEAYLEGIMRRIDAENKLADAEMERWRREDERKEDVGKHWEEDNLTKSREVAKRDTIVVNEAGMDGKGKRKRVKEETREEKRRLWLERDIVRDLKRARKEARRKVKEGENEDHGPLL